MSSNPACQSIPASCQSILHAGEKPSCKARPSPHPSLKAPSRTRSEEEDLLSSLLIPARAHQLLPAASPTMARLLQPSGVAQLSALVPTLLLEAKSNLQAGRGFAWTHPLHLKARHPAGQGLGSIHLSLQKAPAMTYSQGPIRRCQEASCCLVYRSILGSTLTHCRHSKEPFVP